MPWRLIVTATAFVVLPPVLSRVGALPENWAAFLGFGVCYALMALSLNLLMGYAGQISLGHAGLLGVGAIASGIITSRFYMANLWGLLVAALVGGIVAFIVGLPALRLRGLYLAITTIGFVVMLERSVFQLPALTRGSAGISLPRPQANTFIFTRNADYLAYLLVFLLVFWLLDRNVTRTTLGRAFNAIREDEQVAASFGVDVARSKLHAFVIAGVLAGVAGALYGHLLLFVESRTFDLDFSLLLLTFVVVGGLGSRVGVVIASILFGLFPPAVEQLFNLEWLERWAWLAERIEGWEYAVGALLLIYTLARHPGGFAGAIREARERKAAALARQGVVEDEELEQVPSLPALAAPASLARRTRLMVGDTLLDVQDVTVRFGGLTAVDHASIWVPKGAIVGLIGPNGAGKTTLFNAICGFERTASGHITFLQRDITRLPPHQRVRLGIGRTFQRGGLVPGLSVRENLLLAQHHLADYRPVPALAYSPWVVERETDLGGRASEVIAALGFERYADTPTKNLSGGQRRIVEMACALISAPELMLLDEPSAGMAPAVVENLAVRLRELRSRLDRTVLLVEHHIPLVLDVCDLVFVLDHGQVIARGRPDEVVKHPDVLDAYLGRGHTREEVLA